MRSVADIFRAHAILDAQGKHANGCDKQVNHNYGDAYERLFYDCFPAVWDGGEYLMNCCPPTPDGRRYCPKCESDTSHRTTCPDFYAAKTGRLGVKLMMEVGVGRGDSLLAWREIFPNATIVGLDIQQTAKDWLAGQERIEVHAGDATLPDVCASVAGGRQFDLIVDDASHQIGDILATLLWLWPHVRAGGLYVIEDIVRHRSNFQALFPGMRFVDTVGPFEWSRVEPLMVLQRGQDGNG